MNQISFSDAEYAGKRKKTRREVFLEEMELVVPWKVLLKIISPHYPVAGRGRRPYPLESMLRVHLMQNWFALSDPAMEEALYEIASLRSFARLSLNEPIPDETTIQSCVLACPEYDVLEPMGPICTFRGVPRGWGLPAGFQKVTGSTEGRPRELAHDLPLRGKSQALQHTSVWYVLWYAKIKKRPKGA